MSRDQIPSSSFDALCKNVDSLSELSRLLRNVSENLENYRIGPIVSDVIDDIHISISSNRLNSEYTIKTHETLNAALYQDKINEPGAAANDTDYYKRFLDLKKKVNSTWSSLSDFKKMIERNLEVERMVTETNRLVLPTGLKRDIQRNTCLLIELNEGSIIEHKTLMTIVDSLLGAGRSS